MFSGEVEWTTCTFRGARREDPDAESGIRCDRRAVATPCCSSAFGCSARSSTRLRMISEYALAATGPCRWRSWPGHQLLRAGLALRREFGRVAPGWLAFLSPRPGSGSRVAVRHPERPDAQRRWCAGDPRHARRALLVTVSLGRNPDWRPFAASIVLAHLTWIARVCWSRLCPARLVVHATYGSLPSQAPPALPHGSSGWSVGPTGSWLSWTAPGSRWWPRMRSACNPPVAAPHCKLIQR